MGTYHVGGIPLIPFDILRMSGIITPFMVSLSNHEALSRNRELLKELTKKAAKFSSESDES